MTSMGAVVRLACLLLVTSGLLHVQGVLFMSDRSPRSPFPPDTCRGYMELCKDTRRCCGDLICSNLGNGVCVPELEICVCRPKRSLFNL